MTRSYLARQLLLERAKLSPTEAIERLVGMQAQLARPPFLGLWTRLAKFDRETLKQLLLDKTIVRAVAMRGTLHIMTAADFLALRAALQPGLTAGMQTILRDKAKNLPLEPAMAFARTKFPCTFEELRDALEKQFPTCDVRALAYAVRMTLPLVQVPEPDEPWAFPASAKFQAADTWLGASLAEPNPGELVRRYLRGYGPATVRDAQVWTGLPNLAPVFQTLDLVTEGKHYDVRDVPPDKTKAAPGVRFIPAFDNLVLAHHDRTRIIDDAHRAKVTTKNLQVNPTFLVDGRVAGTWKLEGGTAVTLAPFGKLAKPALDQLEAEGARVAKFMEP